MTLPWLAMAAALATPAPAAPSSPPPAPRGVAARPPAPGSVAAPSSPPPASRGVAARLPAPGFVAAPSSPPPASRGGAAPSSPLPPSRGVVPSSPPLAPPPVPPAEAAPLLLDAIPAGPPGLTLEVIASACEIRAEQRVRQVEVRLMSRGRPARGAQPVRSPSPIPCALVRSAGAGRGSATVWQARALTDAATPEDPAASATVTLRPIALAPPLRAVLVEVEAGRAAHGGRVQLLAAAPVGRLRKLWDAEDGVATTRSSVTVSPGSMPGSEALEYERVFDLAAEDPGAPDPDVYERDRLVWNARKRTLERVPAPVFAALYAVEAELAPARALAARFAGKCSAIRPLVVETAPFAELVGRGRYAVATFAADARSLARVAARARSCDAPASPTVLPAR